MENQNFHYFKKSLFKISSLAWPMAISYTFSFAIVAIGIISSYLYQDAEHMAATTLIMTLTNTLSIIAMSPLFAMSILASHHIGELRRAQENQMPLQMLEAKYDQIAAVNKAGMFLSLSITPLVFLLMFFSKALLVQIFHQNANVAEITQHFLRIYAFAMPALLLRICFEQIMFSFAKTKPAMVIGLISFSLGTLLAVFLSFGVGKYQGMGQSGIALSYTLEAYVIAIAYGLYIARHNVFSAFQFFKLDKGFHAVKTTLKAILTIGFPIAFTITNEMILSFILSILAGLLGIHALAALNFAMQFIFFMFIILAAFGQACCQEVSRELGAKKYSEAAQLAKYGLVTTLIYMLPLCLLAALAPNGLMKILSQTGTDAITHKIVLILLPIVAVTVLFDAARYNMLQVLRALHDHIVSTLLSTVSLWCGILLSVVLGLLTSLGIYGVGLGYFLGIACGASVLLVRGMYKINRLTESAKM